MLEKRIVGWNFFLLVGEKCRLKKNVGWKKKVGWKISPAIPGNVRTFPGMQDQKTAEAEKNALRPIGGGKKKTVRHLEKKKLSVGKTKCWLEKNLSVEKKMSVGEFPLPKAEMSRHSLECKTEKRQRRGKPP